MRHLGTRRGLMALALSLAVLGGCSGGGSGTGSEAAQEAAPVATGGEGAPAGDAAESGSVAKTVDPAAIERAVKGEDADSLPADETYGSDVADENMGVEFEAATSSGETFKLSDNRGKVTALVFGYTFCPDVCPTNLLRYKGVLKELGERAEGLRVYFVTVDPERDTIDRMRTYIDLFNPPEAPFMNGIVESDPEKLDKMMKAWKITANRIDLRDGKYLIDHSAGTYLVDKQGVTRLYEPHQLTVKELKHDVEFLLNEPGPEEDGDATASAGTSDEG